MKILHLIIYKANSGKFSRIVSCEDGLKDMQYQDDEVCIESESLPTIDDFENTYYDSDTQSIISIGSQPSEFYVFDYATKSWVLDEIGSWESIRKKRNLLLLESDWTQLGDVPDQVQNLWQTYRQALRDITDQSLESLTWPEPPRSNDD